MAKNGKIIEQAQIITTHNLAVVFKAFKLKVVMKDELERMAQNCLFWICRKQSIKTDNWRQKLKLRKNCAYAWRQMIFYLSFLSDDSIWNFVLWGQEKIDGLPDDVKQDFDQYYQGFQQVVRTYTKDKKNGKYSGPIYLGWQ